ncbi:MAG: oligosaccharide flippase family protein [Bacteroidales bacterium]|nr:oligosaccharide flippase family protein [Bacteroidales bacterium]
MYFTGSAVPAVISFIRLPIFTRYFTPEEYGLFSLVSGTYVFLSMFLFSWIASCLWRFYTEANNNNLLNQLYANLFVLFVAGSVILMLISLIWLLFTGSKIVLLLVILSFFQIVTSQILNLYLIVKRINGKALLYNSFAIIQAVGAFVILILLTFKFNLRIESVLYGQIVVNLLLLIIIAPKIRYSFFSVSHFNRNWINKIFRYGTVGLITNFCILLLISADRYIIAIFREYQKLVFIIKLI